METIFISILHYLLKVVGTTVNQMFVLLGPGLLLAVIMYFISELLRTQAASLLGARFWVYFTAIGTIIHELGHAIFALLFGHKIVEINLFGPDPDTGTLGYVNHSYNPDSLYQEIGNFFIGIGPIIFGSIAVFFSSKYLLGTEVFLPFKELSISNSTFGSIGNLWGFVQETFQSALQVFSILLRLDNLTKWQYYVFIYLALAIGSHIKLSTPDIKGAWEGFATLIGLFFTFNLVTLWASDFASKYIVFFSQLYGFFYALMIFTIILSLAFALIFSVIVIVKRLIKR